MDITESFDRYSMGWLNQGVGRSALFDDSVRVLTDWNFFRAAWLGCFLLWAWYSYRDEHSRLKLIAGLAGVLAATAASKIFQFLWFVHPRPFKVAEELGYRIPSDQFARWGEGNCFPSDTASAYFAVAAVIFGLSRRWGYAAFAWVLIVIALPRVYLLYHWPSDVVAGAMLGTGSVALFQHYRHHIALFSLAQRFERLQPPLFYPVLFLVMYEIVDSFHALEFALHQAKAIALRLQS